MTKPNIATNPKQPAALFGEDWMDWELDPQADDEPERCDD